MAVRSVLRMGNPLLVQRSEEVVAFNTPQLDALIRDMFETMAAESGAGLAAPQIGVLQRVVIFGVSKSARYPDAEEVPTTVLINPVIQPVGRKMEEDWEGCLSVPGLRGLVPRYTHIRYSGFTQKGERFEREATGFHARVVQHECDHLDGILYPRRIRDLRTFGFEDELFRREPKEREAVAGHGSI
jgi:peptide deformylase